MHHPRYRHMSDLCESARGRSATKGTQIGIAPEPEFHQGRRLYGEISGPMLAAVGAKWVIIGHSERRHILRRDRCQRAEKTVAALETGLKPIVCFGERLETT